MACLHDDGKRKAHAWRPRNVENWGEACYFGVIGDLTLERRWGKSGKHFPFLDILAVTIPQPFARRLTGTRVGAR